MRTIFVVAAAGNILNECAVPQKVPVLFFLLLPTKLPDSLTPNVTKAEKRREEVIYEKVRGIKK